MADKKQGIRLRHLDQKEEDLKRDLSPGAANRKKIFQRLPTQKVAADRQNLEEKLRSPKLGGQNQNAEMERLIENLKRKSMEVELRDNMIMSLNREIDELKRTINSKDRQISRLNLELEKISREAKLPRIKDKESNVFQSFRDPVPMAQYSSENGKNFSRNDLVDDPYDRIGNALTEEITMMNLHQRQERRQVEEPEILSPFMALTNHKNGQKTIQKNQFGREHSQTFSGFNGNRNEQISRSDHNNVSRSALINPFEKKNSNSPFGQTLNSPFGQTAPNFQRKSKQMDFRKSHQLQKKGGTGDKFNIFNQESSRSEVRPSGSSLPIEDSREFKFEQF